MLIEIFAASRFNCFSVAARSIFFLPLFFFALLARFAGVPVSMGAGSDFVSDTLSSSGRKNSALQLGH